MYTKINLDKTDINSEPPTGEPARQQYFMERLKRVVEEKSQEYGRPLTACVQTFGCPNV